MKKARVHTVRAGELIDRPFLDRRTFLRGIGGVSLGLPMLEAMLTDRLFAAGPDAGGTIPRRMAFIFFPNGAIMPAWRPHGSGEKFELAETLQPLAELKNDILVISGLAQDNGRPKGDGAGDHARSASVYLTSAHPVKTAGADIRVGISVDQVAAQHLKGQTRLPSLELGIERGRTAGSCDSGYSCAYSSSISWKSPNTPMAKEIDPRAVFERLFGDAERSAAERKRRALIRKSVLDFVAEDARRLRNRLGQADRRKLDEYFTSIREVEARIEQAEQAARIERPDIEIPEGIPRDRAEHIRLMYDLMALAFQTDTTRVITFMLGNAGSNRPYPMVGVNSGHHELSHHRGDENKIAQLKKIDRFLAEQFARFVRKLKSIREGDGSLLDQCMICYGSGLSDGNRHRHDDL
ncbi:MAG: DUF1552 domain-containing protein, partial [Planctomycetota bacterium]